MVAPKELILSAFQMVMSPALLTTADGGYRSPYIATDTAFREKFVFILYPNGNDNIKDICT